MSLSLNTDENCNIPCNRCKKFVAKSKSSLAAHQKGRECLKIYNLNNNNPEKIEDVILNDLGDDDTAYDKHIAKPINHCIENNIIITSITTPIISPIITTPIIKNSDILSTSKKSNDKMTKTKKT